MQIFFSLSNILEPSTNTRPVTLPVEKSVARKKKNDPSREEKIINRILLYFQAKVNERCGTRIGSNARGKNASNNERAINCEHITCLGSYAFFVNQMLKSIKILNSSISGIRY